MGLTDPHDHHPLPTWTRTLNEEDAAVLLDLARPGMPLVEWHDRGDALLPQASRARRRELLKIVERDLLDNDGTTVVPSAFLRLFQEGSPHLRRCLYAGRLLARRPLIGPALALLVQPTIARMEEPLPPDDVDLIPADAWDGFLRDHLPPGTREEAFKKTRSTLQRALANAGTIAVDGNTTRTIRATRGRPDPHAFSWLVAHELREAGRTEASEGWALTESFAARLFNPTPQYARTCLEAGVATRLLSRGYLAGQPRLHPGEEV